MIDGLRDKHRNAIIEVLASNDRVERAILFGSRATETFTPDSDVDIALFGEGLTMTDQGRLATALEESAIPQRVDLVLYGQIDNDALREHIRQCGIEWYKRPKNTPTTRLHLPVKHRRTLEALLREHLSDVEVWAYGSRMSGKSHDGSDLDLVLRGPGLKEIPIDRLEAFEEALRESGIPFLVEAKDWARLPARFRREVERGYVVLVEKLQDRVQTNTRRRHEWPTATIEEIAEKVAMGPFGSSIKVETFVPEGIPIISGQHLHGTRVDDAPGFNFITEEHANKLANANVHRGDIILTHSGNIGQVAYIPKHSRFSRYVVSQRQFYIRCNRSKVLPEFVALYFKSSDGQHQLLANSSQVGVPSIARPVTYLRTVEIPLPSLPEQRTIAHILGTLDDKIELNRRMNETLEAMARAIFKDWFVDFGPTRAKMEGRAPYLDPELWDLFPDALDDEGKPAGWKIKALEEIAQFLNGLALQKFPASDPNRDSLPVIKIAELRAGVTAKSNRASHDVPSRYIVKDGDFLFSWSGSLVAKFWTGGEGALNQHLFKVTSDQYPPWFFSHWVLHHLEAFQAIAAAKATTMGHIQRVHLKQAMTNCPSDNALFILGQTIGSLVESTVKKNLENRTLARTRDLLLQKLMSGEIRMDDAEKAMEAVV